MFEPWRESGGSGGLVHTAQWPYRSAGCYSRFRPNAVLNWAVLTASSNNIASAAGAVALSFRQVATSHVESTSAEIEPLLLGQFTSRRHWSSFRR
jgi:hypothetical protein